MPELIDWADFNNKESGSGRGEIRRLRLESGKTYKVRFIGTPLRYYKYFVAGNSAIVADKDNCPVRTKYNIEPSTRYAINIIDRADGLLKIMECPATVLKPVVSWAKGAESDPGGKAGPDFFIEVTGKAKMTRYTVSALQVTPLTDSEKEYIRANLYDLAAIYKPTPVEELEERLFKKKEEKTSQQQPSAPATAQTVAKANLDW